jgi:hypothetical protein
MQFFVIPGPTPAPRLVPSGAGYRSANRDSRSQRREPSARNFERLVRHQGVEWRRASITPPHIAKTIPAPIRIPASASERFPRAVQKKTTNAEAPPPRIKTSSFVLVFIATRNKRPHHWAVTHDWFLRNQFVMLSGRGVAQARVITSSPITCPFAEAAPGADAKRLLTTFAREHGVPGRDHLHDSLTERVNSRSTSSSISTKFPDDGKRPPTTSLMYSRKAATRSRCRRRCSSRKFR